VGNNAGTQDEEGTTPTAQAPAVDLSMIAKLAAMFGSGSTPGAPGATTAEPPMPQGMMSPDTATASATPMDGSMPPQAPGAPPVPAQGGLMEALKSLMQFFQAKQGSASNDAAYQKDLTDAGMAPGDTGIGR